MQFFSTTEDIESRLAILEATSNELTFDEVEELTASFSDAKLSSRYRLLRDQLIPFIPAERRTEIFALAVACLTSEIRQIDDQTNMHTSTDPSGDHIVPTCQKAFNALDNLNTRLELQTAMCWQCFYPKGSPSSLLGMHSEIVDLLYTSALILPNSKSAKALAKSAFLACDDSKQQLTFLENLISPFKEDPEINAYAVDILVSETTPRNARLAIFESLAKKKHFCEETFFDSAIEYFGEIMPEPYSDDSVVRFLKSVTGRFSFDQSRNIKELAKLIGLDITAITDPLDMPTNKPKPKLIHEYARLERELDSYIELLKCRIVQSSKGLSI